jgi:hypothetical protein
MYMAHYFGFGYGWGIVRYDVLKDQISLVTGPCYRTQGEAKQAIRSM